MIYVHEDIKLGITQYKCFDLIGFRLVLFPNLRGNEKPEEQEIKLRNTVYKLCDTAVSVQSELRLLHSSRPGVRVGDRG